MDFRNNFQTTFGNRSYSYGQYAPAYRYGYTVANDQLYSGREWDVVEADVRSDWERGIAARGMSSKTPSTTAGTEVPQTL